MTLGGEQVSGQYSLHLVDFCGGDKRFLVLLSVLGRFTQQVLKTLPLQPYSHLQRKHIFFPQLFNGLGK